MALKHKSEVDMIQGPEFINLEPLDINPLMSKCEIKVFYLGHNRNGSYINKETATKMAKTLRGTPIVAAWHNDKEDFGTHGHVITISDDGISFTCETIPYGFVSPDAQVWFQNFTDTDEFDNTVERTYLMTTGYLWTGQFEEITKVIQEGQPHSMELDGETLEGHWATDNNLGMDFFIINDATFSKLCVLGDDVEPCYEGSSVTSPQVSANFTQGNEFVQTLFTMMNDLKTALNSKGGLNMSKEILDNSAETVELENQEFTEEQNNVETLENEDFTVEVEDTEIAKSAIEETAEEDFVEKKDDEEADSEDKDDEDADESEDKDDDDKKRPNNNHSLEEYEALQQEVESLRAEVAELRNFKLGIENQQKDALINSYHMLSDADKAEVIAHKSEYSLEDIKAKLAVIYVEKNVDFNAIDGQEVDEPEQAPTMTFSLDEDVSTGGAPGFLQALRQLSDK